jgi:FKBP-type peptidyl-prolyl cis-trans isomerase FklB
MNTTREKASYCIGLETGKNLKQQFTDIDTSLLEQGFKDGLTGASPKLTPDEIKAIMMALRQQVEVQQKQFIAKLAEENRRAGETFLAENKGKDGIVTLPSGLQYKVLKSGNGPSPTLLDTVSTHYKGMFLDNKVFDSSYDRGKPAVFPVNRVMPGWSEALQKMKVGDKWKLFIPSYLAYGEMGLGMEIGPNMTLVFEMELLGINP